ncbi:MAG TPA: hypothetical protein VGN63_18790 [Flavisolibacter sp.]|nr:hypothetical protein [Flavisolibacter sp.]
MCATDETQTTFFTSRFRLPVLPIVFFVLHILGKRSIKLNALFSSGDFFLFATEQLSRVERKIKKEYNFRINTYDFNLNFISLVKDSCLPFETTLGCCYRAMVNSAGTATIDPFPAMKKHNVV